MTSVSYAQKPIHMVYCTKSEPSGKGKKTEHLSHACTQRLCVSLHCSVSVISSLGLLIYSTSFCPSWSIITIYVHLLLQEKPSTRTTAIISYSVFVRVFLCARCKFSYAFDSIRPHTRYCHIHMFLDASSSFLFASWPAIFQNSISGMMTGLQYQQPHAYPGTGISSACLIAKA